jgi:hypothetical protein
MKTTLALALLLSACATSPPYAWRFDEKRTICPAVTWVQVTRDRIPGLCSHNGEAAAPDVSCNVGCVVISAYTADEAKRLPSWEEGVTHYDHEMRHTKGWVHQ